MSGTIEVTGHDHSTEILEAAIPPHLQKERLCPLHAPAGFKPLHASYSARFSPEITRLPIVYLGLQFRPGTDVDAAVSVIRGGIAGEFGPAYHDEARFVDGAGYETLLFVLYWDDSERYQEWKETLAPEWWHAGLAVDGNIGAFIEALTPSVEDTETTFSHPHAEGYSKLADCMSGKTDTHEYWGSARDRIPRGQSDGLQPEGFPHSASPAPPEDTRGQLLSITPHDNLCLLRSGQDWTGTLADERGFYLDHVQPLLETGMREIADDGPQHGCHFNRYVTLEEDGRPIEKTYSVSAWHSLGHLESWVRAKTHLAIWAAGIDHYRKAGDAAKLRLYHELMALRAQDQSYSYFNCHRTTGMLASLR